MNWGCVHWYQSLLMKQKRNDVKYSHSCTCQKFEVSMIFIYLRNVKNDALIDPKIMKTFVNVKLSIKIKK